MSFNFTSRIEKFLRTGSFTAAPRGVTTSGASRGAAPPSASRPPVRPIRRSYDAAALDRLTFNWSTLNLSSDADLRTQLRPLRARSRDLSVNNDYARKFLTMVRTNVVGPKGIALQMMVRDTLASGPGAPDTAANAMIEAAWKAFWERRGACDVTAQLTGRDASNMLITAVMRDGEILARKVRGFDNAHGFAIQLIEADHLDENLNQALPNGNEIRMGVEIDKWKRPVAYHILSQHPGDYSYQSAQGQRYDVIPAGDMIHAYVKERPLQTRGVPWMHTAMRRLNNIGGYEEAEIVAARTGASKMGIITHPAGEEAGIGAPMDADDPEGDLVQEVEPGMIATLPAGYDWKEFDPTHPAGNFGPFMKTTLRGAASGLGVSYNSLATDLEGVNYSSLRAGLLEERDMWRTLQQFVIDHFLSRVFEDWLAWCLLTQKIPLPLAKFDKFNAPSWRPRGWAWVDPAKDQKANTDAVAAGFDSRTNIVAQEGRDIEEVFTELAAEEELARRKGITLTLNTKPAAPEPPPAADEGDGTQGGE